MTTSVASELSIEHDVINPATAEVVTTLTLVGLAETDAAIDRASKAFETWRAVAPADRGRLLRRFADAVDAASEELAQLEVANSGHTIGNARWEAGNVRDVLTYYSAAPERLFGRQIPVAGASTSRSANRSESLASSCPGISPCRSRVGGSRPPWPLATRSC